MRLSEKEVLHTYRIKMAKEGRSDKRTAAYRKREDGVMNSDSGVSRATRYENGGDDWKGKRSDMEHERLQTEAPGARCDTTGGRRGSTVSSPTLAFFRGHFAW